MLRKGAIAAPHALWNFGFSHPVAEFAATFANYGCAGYFVNILYGCVRRVYSHKYRENSYTISNVVWCCFEKAIRPRFFRRADVHPYRIAHAFN